MPLAPGLVELMRTDGATPLDLTFWADKCQEVPNTALWIKVSQCPINTHLLYCPSSCIPFPGQPSHRRQHHAYATPTFVLTHRSLWEA